MMTAKAYDAAKTEAKIDQLQSDLAAEKRAKEEAERGRDEARKEISGIEIYASDTLSGRTQPDPATYTEWLIEGIREIRRRAQSLLAPKEDTDA